MKRRKMNRSNSKKLFSKTAAKVHPKNNQTQTKTRGGIIL